MADSPGRFCWYELMSTDPSGAKAFYPKITGWGLQGWDGGAEPYTMWMVNGIHVGGLMKLPPEAQQMGAPSHWVPYIGTADVDATVAKAGTIGGRVLVPPMDIPKVGRFAVLQDPQGAVFAAFSSSNQGGETVTGLGGVGWHELFTTDAAAAYTFYNTLFGWEKTAAMDMGPMGIYQMFGQGTATYGGMFNKPPNVPAPPHWLVYVTVPDVKVAAEAVKANGGQVLNGPMEVPGGDWIIQCLDPQGAAVAFFSKKPA